MSNKFVSTLKRLNEYLNPGSGHIRPWDVTDKVNEEPDIINTSEASKSYPSLGVTLLHSPSSVPPSDRQSTPSPYEIPWWDPSSRTPMPDKVFSSWLPVAQPRLATSGTESSIQRPVPSKLARPDHVLMNQKLAGIRLQVVANGGVYINKEMSASISIVEGHNVIRMTKYKSSLLLDPEWTRPKKPSPTHDNGLLVVVQGDHCGKYVRRIHHHRHDGTTSVVVGVVTRCEGAADTLTEEKIELDPEYLCTVPETKLSKELNRNLMSQIRKAHQHLNR